MKRFLKISFLLLLALIFILIGFFLWASSPNLPAEEYAFIRTANPETTASKKDSFKILTYNIGYLSGMTNNLAVEKPKELFDSNLEKVQKAIAELKPDIIAFQEIDYMAKRSFHTDQETKLAELGYPFVARTVNWDKKYLPFPYYPPSMHFGKIVSGQSILSKYPITKQERIVLQRNDKNPFYYDSFYIDRLAQVAQVQLNLDTLTLINVHLEAYDQETRAKQMEHVIDIYKKYSFQGPTILLGDFNSDPRYTDPAIQNLMNLEDTGNAAFNSDSPQNTFSSRNPSERLDYIFYNTTFIQEIGSEIPENFGEASDHIPVLLEIKLKNINYGEIN
jgi:endonuclease/exonuclease/phosphatase family metal-dependent hydrolase